MRPIAALLIFFALAGCNTTQRQIDLAQSLDVDHFKQTMKITDDRLEPVVTFSTVGGFQEKRGLLGIVWSDSFMRGYIDKSSGKQSFVVYVAMRHTEGDWLHPYQANYGRPLQTTKTKKVNSDVDCSGKDLYNSCTYSEHVVFDVEIDEVMRVWNETTTEQLSDLKNSWFFKVKNQGGQDYTDAILLPEMLALVEAMNEYDFIPTQ